MRRLAFILCVLTWTVAAHATSLAPADLGTLSREARIIVRGRVIGVSGRVTGDRLGIDTLVTLAVESSLKGSVPATLQFSVPGGRVGRFRRIVVGAPQFLDGQRVVVFLGAPSAGPLHVLGLSQGVYRIRSSSEGTVVMPPVLMARPGEITRIVRGAAERRPVPLARFERDVVALARGSR